jgi:site-specific DNA-methyltransferase (adenine-specific)
VLKQGGVLVWIVADATKDGSESGTSMEQALHFRRLGLNLHDTMIYEKAGTGACGSNLAYWQTWEYAFVLSKGRPKAVNRLRMQALKAGSKTTNTQGRRAQDGSVKTRTTDRTAEECIRSNVWRYAVGDNGDDRTGHPAVFPEQLAKDHISSWSNPGDVVLDPFSGSGTTCKASKELERHWIGIDVNPDYVEICHRRTAQDVLRLFEANASMSDRVAAPKTL